MFYEQISKIFMLLFLLCVAGYHYIPGDFFYNIRLVLAPIAMMLFIIAVFSALMHRRDLKKSRDDSLP